MRGNRKGAVELTRAQVLTGRRAIGSLDKRLPPGARSLRQAAWAGLQDSMPRAALLSIHARVAETTSSALDDPSLVQLWGPRFSVFVVAAADRAIFSLGLLPETATGRQRAEHFASGLREVTAGGTASLDQAARALGVHPNAFRYAAATGTVLIRWDGARRPEVWTVPPPEMDPREARLELARRYVHVYGPTTPESFATWSGLGRRASVDVFAALRPSLLSVTTAIGEAWILATDESIFTGPPAPVAPARLLPSGDSYYLLQGSERELVVADPENRAALWTTRVWPGAVLLEGEVAGTWRRSGSTLTVSPWRPLSSTERDNVEREASHLPLPSLVSEVVVR
jgi:Winged helix DNA-binding domain